MRVEPVSRQPRPTHPKPGKPPSLRLEKKPLKAQPKPRPKLSRRILNSIGVAGLAFIGKTVPLIIFSAAFSGVTAAAFISAKTIALFGAFVSALFGVTHFILSGLRKPIRLFGRRSAKLSLQKK